MIKIYMSLIEELELNLMKNAKLKVVYIFILSNNYTQFANLQVYCINYSITIYVFTIYTTETTKNRCICILYLHK
jgi:hypothetical protein